MLVYFSGESGNNIQHELTQISDFCSHHVTIPPLFAMTEQTTTPPEKKSPTRLRGMLAVIFVLVLTAWLLNTPPGLEGKAEVLFAEG